MMRLIVGLRDPLEGSRPKGIGGPFLVSSQQKDLRNSREFHVHLLDGNHGHGQYLLWRLRVAPDGRGHWHWLVALC